jgi:hypothetical protein
MSSWERRLGTSRMAARDSPQFEQLEVGSVGLAGRHHPPGVEARVHRYHHLLVRAPAGNSPEGSETVNLGHIVLTV